MKAESNRDNSWPVVLSVITTVVILMFGLIIVSIENADLIINFRSLLGLIISNKFLWILTAQLVVLPVITYVVAKRSGDYIHNLEAILEEQRNKAKSVTNYVDNLIQGDYSIEFDSEQEQDNLNKSLTKLRDTLKSNKEIVDKQRKEDENRNWHAEGHAKFGEILRDNTDFEKLAFRVIKELTEYCGAIQGGFYHLEGEDQERFFNLMAFYAYGRKKYADKKLPWGKGLIGTAAVEKKTIHMNNLPDGYIAVTSGLGQANPDEIVVCPLVFEGELFGVLEIASIETFDTDKVKFIEKVAESTASTISTVRMNMRTKHLLTESKEQAQTLASQEEEMRQNMEELKATQEEAARQADRFLRLENTVNHTMIRAEYNMDGILLYANLNFLNKLDYSSNSQVEGKHISMFISRKDEEWFNRIWSGLSEGGRHFEGYMKHVTKSGKDLWTMATYTCVRDDEGDAERILFLALDTTEQKKISLNLEAFQDAVSRSSINVEFDTNGNLTTYSDSFLYLFKYTAKEAASLNISDLIDPLELENFNKKWENIVNGMNFEGNFKVRTKNEEESYLQGAFSAVYNQYGEVDKVILIGHDLTSQKFMEIEIKSQNDTLKKQEKLLRENEKELSRKLREAKLEMQEQFKEIEAIKIRNERTLEGALDAIVQTSNDNKIIFYNQAAEKLLNYAKKDVIGQDVSMFFSKEALQESDFVERYTKNKGEKLVGMRTEIKIKPKDNDELSVLCLLSKAQVDNEITYTAFIQTIEVELF